MAEHSAADALHEAGERAEQLESGSKLVPVCAAVIAVLAAIATLFSNHSSVAGLERRTLAGIMQTRAADQYGYYESSRIKIEVNQALSESHLVTNPTALHTMHARIAKEERKSGGTLRVAHNDEASAHVQLADAERSLGSYERYEVSATLFDVSIVLVSITALTRGSKALLWLGLGLTVVGLGYFTAGFIHI
ncbi:MAG TPA: DUF4337 family protein [Candidatus Dormibacteraeota bacterium]|nr:DUF4337 family protein [Candidatus Dormibacteraeota bacterium]